MALSFLLLFAANQIDNAAPETLFTVPAAPSSNILRNGRVRFANTTAAPVTIKAWAIPAAGAAADANVCLPVQSVGANAYIDVDVPVMAAGGFMQALAGAAASITASMLDGFIQS